ncbi:MAG: TIGR04076 family protein [Candidatus Heimdallarchaeaceae archaeon]
MTEEKKVTIEVVDILEAGTCNYKHKIGDKFNHPEDRGKICAAAYQVIYPYAMAIRMGASFPWEEDQESISICCPDYKNPVVFKITKE